jgi:hypothetical protein
VNSSTEMFFKPGTIQFGLSGEVELDWNSSPCVALDMEFHHHGVAAYFRLVLLARQAGVDVSYISFEGGSANPDENTKRLSNAIADARIVRQASSRRAGCVNSA